MVEMKIPNSRLVPPEEYQKLPFVEWCLYEVYSPWKAESARGYVWQFYLYDMSEWIHISGMLGVCHPREVSRSKMGTKGQLL